MAKVSPETWAKAKALRESGKSFREIEKLLNIPFVTISDRSKRESWVNGNPESTKRGIVPLPYILYIITAKEFDGIYKIGITNDIEFRLTCMQTGCPFKLFASRVYVCENPKGIEFSLHSFFKKKRLEGEWFKLTDVDIAYIDEALSDG
jgi:hypothetical protein